MVLRVLFYGTAFIVTRESVLELILNINSYVLIFTMRSHVLTCALICSVLPAWRSLHTSIALGGFAFSIAL